MAVFKCKMCGGALEIQNNETVVECEYCGTKQTLPRLDDDRKANLYDRANHFRRNNEFDKAMGIYEQILNEDNTDAEAYWSLVLCRYGIEYVEDPASHKRVPTVNRAQFTSVFDDDNYKSALQYADPLQKSIYEDEAKAINEIQKGILAISQNEEPFDVFICYKETDSNGRRTPDSVLATELYQELTREGFKVFFARITLEDKLGSAYEPYIFAALNSAKVMVALGTKPEYFNAVWVKNEWSRYLALIKNGAKKMLIPAYKDMDPYDLPEEFSHLQAQDMSKLGFMQDLVRGITKIAGADEKVVAKGATVESSVNTVALLKRAFIFLEDNDWVNADEYLEKVLDAEPENALAYVGKLMLQLHVARQEDLAVQDTPFDNNSYYEKAVRYANDELKADLIRYITTINNRKAAEQERLENERLQGSYKIAKKAMESATCEGEYIEAAVMFGEISSYLDAAELAEECQRCAELARCEELYMSANRATTEEYFDMQSKANAFKFALETYEKIPDYKDSAERISKLKSELEELNKKIEIQSKRNKKIAIIISSVSAFIIAFLIVLFNVVIPAAKYSSADKCVANKEYERAIEIYESIIGYKDSADKIISVRYLYANYCLENKEFAKAVLIFSELGKYEDSIEKLTSARYYLGLEQIENKNYKDAFENFTLISDYEDSKAKRNMCSYYYAKQLMEEEDYENALQLFLKYRYEDSEDLIKICYQGAVEIARENKDYAKIVRLYEATDKLDEKDDIYLEASYNYAKQLREDSLLKAIDRFETLGDYKDTQTLLKRCKYDYIIGNKYLSDYSTGKFLDELKAENYLDTVKIYKELTKWNIELVAVNTDRDDYTTNNGYIPRNCAYLHMEFRLTGGDGGSIDIYHKTKFPNESKYKADWMWENKFRDYLLGIEWANGLTNVSTGTFTIEFYNAEDDSFIQSIDIPVK